MLDFTIQFILIKYLKLEIKWIGKDMNEFAKNKKNKQIIVQLDKKYIRPLDVNTLLGNATKAKNMLKCKTKIAINNLIQDYFSIGKEL